jgi:hypothetical protein
VRRSAGAGKRRYPLRVSVIDGHLITVFSKACAEIKPSPYCRAIVSIAIPQSARFG